VRSYPTDGGFAAGAMWSEKNEEGRLATAKPPPSAGFGVTADPPAVPGAARVARTGG
jgi:hypothetical protein